MNTFVRLRGRQALSCLALALVLSVVGCSAEEPPKVIDTTTPAKAPMAPTATTVAPSAPAK